MLKASRPKKGERKFFDIHTHQKRRFIDLLAYGRIVNLKPFIKKQYQPLLWGSVVVVVFISAFVFWKIFTRAGVADFFPATCLGDWQNPQYAQGEPDTFNDLPAFHVENSATFNGGISQIFCGNFVPENYREEGNIQSVGLTLVWSVDNLENLIPDFEPEEKAPSEEAPPEESEPPHEEEILPEEEAAPEEPPVQEETPIEEAPAEEPYVPPAEETEPPVETATSTTSAKERQNLLNRIIRIAFAQEQTGTSTTQSTPELPPANTEATTTEEAEPPPEEETPEEIIAPPIILEIEPASPASSQGVPTTSTEEEITPPIETEMTTATEAATSSEDGAPPQEETILPPNQPDTNFLMISYSFDGKEWTELGRVNPKNWENFTVSLPIATWEELKQLQIRIEGITTILAGVPRVFLDGMLVEVHFELPPDIEIQVPQPQNEELRGDETPEEVVIRDEHAIHTCSIEPFSQEINAGETAAYVVRLEPSDPSVPFQLETGKLPGGIRAAFSIPEEHAATSRLLALETSENGRTGSFSLIVLYKEFGENLEPISNFCKLNLIVKN